MPGIRIIFYSNNVLTAFYNHNIIHYKEITSTALGFEGDMAQYTPWRWHNSAKACRGGNLVIVFLLR